jgi:hypothetical protein
MTTFSRRRFIGEASAAAVLHPFSSLSKDAAAKPMIKIGLIGAGGRYGRIAGFFKQDGGYEFHAVADYFQPVAEKSGAALGVDKTRCFSGLPGFHKVIESGVDAVVLETPPFFFPDRPSQSAWRRARRLLCDPPLCQRLGAQPPWPGTRLHPRSQAAARGSELTMEQLLKENRKPEPDLKGLIT